MGLVDIALPRERSCSGLQCALGVLRQLGHELAWVLLLQQIQHVLHVNHQHTFLTPSADHLNVCLATDMSSLLQ